MSIEQYTGPVEETSDVDRDKIYLITVSPHAGGRPRSFLGEWYSIAWDQKSGESSSYDLVIRVPVSVSPITLIENNLTPLPLCFYAKYWIVMSTFCIKISQGFV